MNGAASSRSPAALLPRGPLAARAQQSAMPGFLNAVHPPEWVALNNINETGNRRWVGEQGSRGRRRSQAKLWVAVGIAIAVVATAWLAYSYRQSDAAASAPAALPQVVVSKPLEREVDSRLGFLGQYEIRLAQAKAQLETANARLVLAGRELHRAEVLAAKGFGTEQTVDQRTADQRTGQAAVDDAKAQIRDAEFDFDHCRITAPFTGRIGTHLVSVGNLIAGSRTATSPTTVLTTLVSLDPIYLDFDMSESDFLTFSRDRARLKGGPADKIEIALSDETEFARQGTLDFVDNALNRSSGTIHARATVPNPDRLLTPGGFARVKLVVGTSVPALLVPDTAVLPDQSQHLVMTVAPDGTVVPKQVEIGDLRGGLRVIRSGLTPSDQVIIEGIPHAAAGAKVAPQVGTIHYAAAGDQG